MSDRCVVLQIDVRNGRRLVVLSRCVCVSVVTRTPSLSSTLRRSKSIPHVRPLLTKSRMPSWSSMPKRRAPSPYVASRAEEDSSSKNTASNVPPDLVASFLSSLSHLPAVSLHSLGPPLTLNPPPFPFPLLHTPISPSSFNSFLLLLLLDRQIPRCFGQAWFHWFHAQDLGELYGHP